MKNLIYASLMLLFLTSCSNETTSFADETEVSAQGSDQILSLDMQKKLYNYNRDLAWDKRNCFWSTGTTAAKEYQFRFNKPRSSSNRVTRGYGRGKRWSARGGWISYTNTRVNGKHAFTVRGRQYVIKSINKYRMYTQRRIWDRNKGRHGGWRTKNVLFFARRIGAL